MGVRYYTYSSIQ